MPATAGSVADLSVNDSSISKLSTEQDSSNHLIYNQVYSRAINHLQMVQTGYCQSDDCDGLSDTELEKFATLAEKNLQQWLRKICNIHLSRHVIGSEFFQKF